MSFFEAENTLSAATATGQWAQPDCYGLDVAAALFFPLFLLGRSRNLRERGGGRGDLRLLLFWLSLAVSVASSGRRLFQIKPLGLKIRISTHLHDVFYYRNLFCS